MNSCSPGTEEVKTGGPWGSLTSQCNWIGELQAQWGTLSQKLRWMTTEQDPSRSEFGLYMHKHICACTHVHIQRKKRKEKVRVWSMAEHLPITSEIWLSPQQHRWDIFTSNVIDHWPKKLHVCSILSYHSLLEPWCMLINYLHLYLFFFLLHPAINLSTFLSVSSCSLQTL